MPVPLAFASLPSTWAPRSNPPPRPAHPARQIDLFGESTRGNLHFADEDDAEPRRRRIDDVLGLRNAEDILAMPWAQLRSRSQALLGELGIPPSTYPNSQPQRALFTNRTLNLRSIQAVGYDMDYSERGVVLGEEARARGCAWQQGWHGAPPCQLSTSLKGPLRTSLHPAPCHLSLTRQLPCPPLLPCPQP